MRTFLQLFLIYLLCVLNFYSHLVKSFVFYPIMLFRASVTGTGSVSLFVEKTRLSQRRYLNRLLFESDEIIKIKESNKDISFGVLNEADSRYKHIEKVISGLSK
jgi:hypothetical protein